MNKIYNKNIYRVKFILFYSFCLLLYLFYWRYQYHFMMIFFGIPIIYYYPGKLLMEIFSSLRFSNGKFGQFSLSVLYSFILCNLLGYAVQTKMGFNSDSQIWIILVINIVLFVAYLISLKLKKINDEEKDIYPITYLDYIPIILFNIALLIIILINPFAQNADNYLILLKESIRQNVNYIDTRLLFNSSIGLAGKFLSINIFIIQRYIFIILFSILSLGYYDYLKRNFSSKSIIALLYLSLLIPSVILSEINIIRPQVVILALILPVLILLTDAVKSKNILASIIALTISLIGMVYHELSVLLVVMSLLSGVIIVFAKILERKISWKTIALSCVVILPYLYILKISNIFYQTIFVMRYAFNSFSGIHLRWWFINNYVTVDGVNLGWTGVGVVYYYLYNGFLLLLFLIYIIIIILKNRIKTPAYLFIPIIYFIIYFSVAEILPRMGLFFIPNRAWVYIMISLIIILALFLEIIIKNGNKIKYINLLIPLLIIGYLGSLYVAKNNIYSVYPDEIPVASYIENSTPGDSLILSSQENNTLVELYGNRKFGHFASVKKINRDEFDKLIDIKLRELSQKKYEVMKPKIVQITQYWEYDTMKKEVSSVTQKGIGRVDGPLYTGSNSVYFLYSYKKLGGINDDRGYRQDIIDSINVDTYQQLGYPIVYRDDYTILIKIK